jgi:ABC-type bacteriocin/lantibiotic exporter with double-glycine peptidase domain
MGTGVLLRGAMITAIYNKALTLSTRARHLHPNGKLVNHISTDVSRIDFASQFFHTGWTAPIQLIICLAILIVNLGPSALAGFAVFVVIIPFQVRAMRHLLRFRQKTVVYTDRRAKLLQELLSGIKIIKLFAWEDPYLVKINQVRNSETSWVLLSPSAKLRVLTTSPGISVPLSSSEPLS